MVIQNKLTKSLIILPILGIIILSFIYINIHANNATMNSSAVTTSETNNLTIADDEYLTLTFVDDEGNPTTNTTVISVTPDASGVFNSGNVNVKASTNVYHGYNLSMSATTTSLSGSVAVGNAKPTIPTLESASSEGDFPNNRWGFKRSGNEINDTLYQPMRAGATIPVDMFGDGANATAHTSTVNFGVKLNNETPSGNYDIAINFLAVANINTPYYMQNITDAELANLMPSVNDTYTLTDSRDNKQYTVAKLKDGQYWMTTNLDLAGGTTLTPNDSDIVSNYTLPTSSKTGFDDNTKAFVYNSNSTNCSSADGCYSYYSWNAATAMSGTSITTDNTDASSSICPAGWHLPTSRKTDTFDMTIAYESDFYTLTTNYGMSTGTYNENPDSSPTFCSLAGDCSDNIPHFVRAGWYNNSAFSDGGVHGIYWSSASANNNQAYILRFHASRIFSAVNNDRNIGFSVRCIHNATMQNLTDTEVAAMNTNETKVLYDSRDNQRYTATKLLDGKLWMTKNLNLAGGTTLTSADTDMPAGYTLPTANGFGANNTLPTSSKTGFSDNTQAYVFNSNSTDCTNADGCYSYYSWHAATLGSGVNLTEQNATAPYSICPKGWRLPTANSTMTAEASDYNRLLSSYGVELTVNGTNTSTFYNNAGPNTIPNFLFSAVYKENGFNQNQYGTYWSATVSGQSAKSYRLGITQDYSYPNSNDYNEVGMPIRCLYDSSMQNFTTTDASALAEHDELTLTDRRDGKTYYVAKLKDGKVWMTKNLNLAGGTTITPADSDVAENYTLPASSTTGFDNDGAEYAYVYNSGNNDDSFCDEANKQPCYSYYSYNAATAMSGTSINADNTDAPYSICPAGWQLPTSRSTVELAQGTPGSDFYKMAINYGLNPADVNEPSDTDPTFCDLGGDCSTNTVPRFLRAGFYNYSTFYNGGAGGNYWSSTASNSTGAHHLTFFSGGVYSADNYGRRLGFSVRCLLRTE